MPTDLKRSIGFWGGCAVMIGVIIGSGIFRTPPEIAKELSSPPLILAMWVLGGLLCLAGAFTYAELGAMFPASGGVYVFIREGFGSCAAFVFGWSYLLIVKPFAAGGIALVFGEHVNTLFGVHWNPKIVTSVMLLSLTVINIRGVTLSTAFAAVLTALKLGALIAIVGLALALIKGDAANLKPTTLPGPQGLESLSMAIVGVMSAILWTYDGWADVGSIAGEVKSPQKELPRIYIGGTAAIILVYVAVNAVYFMLVPLHEMRAMASEPDHSLAPLVMTRLVGSAGGIAVTLIVLISTLGSSHASIMTGARVSYAQARDGLLFKLVGHVHPRYTTPDAALIIQVLLSIVAIWALSGFQELMDGFVFTMWIFYGMAAAAVIILRIRRPNADRPFRCPGYPFIPALFVLCALVMTGLSIYKDWKHTVPWLGVLAVGVPIYYIWQGVNRGDEEPTTPG